MFKRADSKHPSDFSPSASSASNRPNAAGHQGRAVVALSLLLAMAACTSETVEPKATWHRDVRAGMEKWCSSCHTAGGAGPFALDDRGTAKAMANPSIAAIEGGTMPPMRANDACRSYEGQWMTDSDATALARALKDWRESDFAAGEEADYKAPDKPADPLEIYGKPDLSLKPTKGYVPKKSLSDDYRCYALDHVFNEETFVLMSNIAPDQRELVHHVLVYAVPANFVGALTAMDDAEEGDGYTCFGGAGVGSPSPVAGWAPGDMPVHVPEGTGIRVPAGAKLVMQVHYNLAAEPKLDRTQLDLWTTTNKPKHLLVARPMPHFGIKIPAGAKGSTHKRRFKNSGKKDWEFIATTPHMHTFGRKISVHKIGADGKRECLADVKRYDFNWQLSYPFRASEPVIVKPGEELELSCTYDNAAADQPRVNGKQVAPQEVTWGEGTLDEMCLNYALEKRPYFPEEDSTKSCPGFDKCYSDCRKDKDFGTCVLSCGQSVGGTCQTCVYTATIQCGLTGSCVTKTAPLFECISDCGSAGSCVFTKCGGQLNTFQKCIGPEVDQGKCTPQLAACGVKI